FADIGFEDAFSVAVQRADFAGVRLNPGGAGDGGMLEGDLVDLLEQLVEAALAHGDCGHDWHAEIAREAVEIDVDAAALGDVEHVEREDAGAADLAQLKHEAQHEAQIAGVSDADNDVGRGFAGEFAEYGVAGDDFVEAARAQTVSAREVEHADTQAG